MAKRIQLFEQFNNELNFDAMLESVTGEIKNVQQDVDTVIKDLEADKEAADDNDVKAALLMAAIDADGDLDNIDLEKVKNEVKENNKIKNLPAGQEINESAGGLVHTLELIGNFAGNADLIHFITGKIEKATGKKIDGGKVAKTIQGIAGALKKVSGLPAKALIKFFDWVASKLGIEGDSAKGFNMVARIVVLVFLLALGVYHFPVLGAGILMQVLSITGILGKSVEILHIGKEILELIKNAKKDPKKFKEETGLSDTDMEAMIA